MPKALDEKNDSAAAFPEWAAQKVEWMEAPKLIEHDAHVPLLAKQARVSFQYSLDEFTHR